MDDSEVEKADNYTIENTLLLHKPIGGAMFAIAILGLVGVIFMVLTLGSVRRTTGTIIILLAMALSEWCLLASYLKVLFLFLFTKQSLFHEYQFFWFPFYTLNTIYSWLLVLLVAEQVRSRPHEGATHGMSKKKAIIIVVSVVVASFAYHGPCHLVKTMTDIREMYPLVVTFSHTLTPMITFGIPTLTLVYVDVMLARQLTSQRRSSDHQALSEQTADTDDLGRQVDLKLPYFSMVTAYILFVTPALVLIWTGYFRPMQILLDDALLIVLLYTTFNFLIFLLCSREFRGLVRQARERLCCQTPANHGAPPSTEEKEMLESDRAPSA